MLIYKICRREDWVAAQAAGTLDGSAKDRADGFLHFSTAGQLAETLARHYANATELVLLAVDADVLGPALMFEPSRGGELFPHLYGPLPISAVRWSRVIHRNPGKPFVLPAEILEIP